MDLQNFPVVDPGQIGWVTEIEMIEVDRIMIEDLNIELLQMMENAGRNLARVVIEGFAAQSVAIAVGSGGNGGGGMVAARHLANAGLEVSVVTTRAPDGLSGVPAHQLGILQAMGVSIVDELPAADVAVDAVVGYSLKGPPRGKALGLIGQIADFGGPVVALDTPSGLNVTSGETPGAVVEASLTMTLALPKTGLRDAPQVGRLLLADISVPRHVSLKFGPSAPNFRLSPILALG